MMSREFKRRGFCSHCFKICLWTNHDSSRSAVTKCFNLSFAVTGVIFICLGLWIKSLYLMLENIAVEAKSYLPLVLILCGIFIILIVCIFTISRTKSPTFSFMYSLCLFVCFIFEVSLALLFLGFMLQSKSGFRYGIQYHMDKYLKDNSNPMDVLQIKLKCCGNDDPKDWLSTPLGQVPQSCCAKHFCDPTTRKEIYSQGCYNKILTFAQKPCFILIVIVFLCAFFPFFGSYIIFYNVYLAMSEK